MARPRVLAVAPDYPWPVRSGGGRRLAAVFEALHDEFDLHVVTLEAQPRPTEAPPMPGLEPRITHVRRSGSRVDSLREMARGLPARRPLSMAHYWRPDAAAAVRHVYDETQPDAVFAFQLGGARLVTDVVPPQRTVLDLDNAEHTRFATMARVGRGLQRPLWMANAVMVRQWMARCLGQYSAVSLASSVDVAACRAVAPDARYLEVPNGVDTSMPMRNDPNAKSVLLLGDLSYPPNADATRWFVDDIVGQCPTVSEVRIVGGGPMAERSADPRVNRVGFVPDVGPELRRAGVLVAALRAGGGTRLKILEAMAAGTPVVSTTLGAEGLAVTHREHVLLADTADDIAAAVEQIISDSALRRRLVTSARKLAQDRYAWKQCVAPLLHALHDTAAQR